MNLAWILVPLLAAGPRPTPAPAPAAGLAALVTHLTDDSGGDELRDLSRAAAEAGPDGFPQLVPLLASKSLLQRSGAAYALAFTGHPDVPKTLLDYYSHHPPMVDKPLVCFALAQRGTPSDVRFLVRALKGEQFGESWQPIEIAALALGVLRDPSSLGPLRATAQRTSGSIASGAARQALDWIREGPYGVPEASESPSLEPVLAVMAHGVPRITDSADFIEGGGVRVWHRRDRTWSVQSIEESGLTIADTASISFDTFVSSDGFRAIVSVGLVFGELNGVGYDYLLFRKGGAWRVVGILPTWIS